MTLSSAFEEPVKAENFMTRLVDRVFGYDFFLSYSRSDGMHLPQRLKERLETAGFRVFLDQTEYVAGTDLRRETRRQVLKSRKIVVIGRPGAFRSEWVKREIATAASGDVNPVILDLNGALAAAPDDAPLAIMARQHDWLRLTETLVDPDGEPSDRIVQELVRSFNHTRQETKRQRIFGIAALVLLVTASIATWQAIAAVNARNNAQAEQKRAETALRQIRGTADRMVQSLALQSRKRAQTAAATNEVPPCEPAHLKDLDDIAAAAVEAGLQERARDMLAACLATAQARVAEAPDALDWRQAVADLQQRLGELHDSPDLSDPGADARLVEAEKHYQQAATIWRDLTANALLQQRAEVQLATSLGRLGHVQFARKELQPALTSYQERVTLLDQLTRANPAHTDLQRMLSASYQQMADTLLKSKQFEDALVWADKDLATFGDVAAIDRAEPGRQRDLASSYDRRAQALQALGRNDEARDLFRKATALLDHVISGNGAEPSWRRDAATLHEEMGTLLGIMGDSDRALEQYQVALGIRELLATSQESPGWLSELTAAYRNLSEATLKIDRVTEAHEMAEQYLLAAAFNTDVGKADRLRRALGTVCWHATNDRNSDDDNRQRAVWVGERAIELSPELDWVKVNYAHALLLSADPKDQDAAKQIYRLIGGSKTAAKLKQQVVDDFATLKKHGHASPLMADVEAELGLAGLAAN
jgi:tetratricopeptide (TPR) repeat protein